MNKRSLEHKENFYSKINYKSCLPEETIQRIRDILFENEISTIESDWFREEDLRLFSLTLVTVDFPHRVQGKGINEQYALASAYAELMERLQNVSVLFGRNNIKKLSTPDQTAFDHEIFKESYYNIYQTLFPKNKYSDSMVGEYIKSLPDVYNVSYYRVNDGAIALLPERLLVASTGSSGMCAGNTPSEAIIQGICEIFERFVLKQIYYSKPCLPNIPKSLFKNHVICSYFIEEFENRGFEVIVKDCSFDGKYPVVGVFLKKENSCIFKLGAAPHFCVATERCFTEIFQGRSVASIENVFVPIEDKFDMGEDVFKEEQYWNEQFYKTLTFDSGALKSVILEKSKGFEENNLYAFDDSSSNTTLERLISRTVKNESLYIRDTSFLGFPTFYVYMPAFSALYYSDFDNIKLTERERLVKIFFNLENISKNDKLYLNKSLHNKKSSIQSRKF